MFVLTKNCIKYKLNYFSFIDNYALLCNVYIFIGVGYFYSSPLFEIDHDEIITLVLFIQSIFLIIRRSGKSLKNESIITAFLLILSICISLLILKIFPYNIGTYNLKLSQYDYYLGIREVPEVGIQSLRFLIRIVMHLCIALALGKVLDGNNLYRIVNKIIKFSIFISVIILFELINNIYHILEINEIIRIIFGRSSIENLQRGGLYSLKGFHTEPSHLAIGYWTYLLIIIFSSTKRKNFLIFISLIILLLSMSLTGFLFFIAGIFLYYLTDNTFGKISKRKTLILFFLFFIVIFIYFTFGEYYNMRIDNSIKQIFDNKIIQTDNSGSEILRMAMTVEAFQHFLRRPLFGIGLGTVWSYSAIPTILANIGILGIFVYTKFTFSISRIGKIKNKLIFVYAIIIFVYLFSDTIRILYSPSLLLFNFIVGTQFSRTNTICVGL